MKKLLFIFTFILAGIFQLSAQAPSYKLFELDLLGLGYASPVGNDKLSSGSSVSTGLRFNLMDNLSVGLESEYLSFGFKESSIDTLGSAISTSAVVEYYLNTTSSKRAFVGIGFGTTKGGDIKTPNGDQVDITEGQSSYSISPRVGYEYGHLRLFAKYNHSFKSETPNYLSVGATLTLWGAYKGKE